MKTNIRESVTMPAPNHHEPSAKLACGGNDTVAAGR